MELSGNETLRDYGVPFSCKRSNKEAEQHESLQTSKPCRGRPMWLEQTCTAFDEHPYHSGVFLDIYDDY